MSDGSVVIDTKLNNKGVEDGLSKISGIAQKALKGIAVATGAVTVAFTGMVKASVNARGEMEQQIGGVETLFKNSADKVIENANRAYKTAGMSANQYMQLTTSFSASLLQSLAGDTDKAADIADMAMVDMSDNANKMGTSMEAITNAYQGFAKQNYTMLDNLKLGYGGTKTEMERLLKDAQKLTGVKYDINNLSDVYEAIHVIQGELGITGTTAKESAETLQGSISSLKASWENFLSGAGDINQVIDSGKVAIENIVRITKEALTDIGGQLKDLLEEKLQPIKQWVEEHQTQLIIITGVIGTLTAAVIAYNIAQNATAIGLGVLSTATTIATAVTSAFGAVLAFITSPITLVVLAIGALITIIVLLVKNWDTVKAKTIEIWENIKQKLTEILTNIRNKFSEIWTRIKDTLKAVLENIMQWFKDLPYRIGYFIGELLGKIIKFGIDAFNWVTTKVPQIINGIINFFAQLPSKIWNFLLTAISKIIQWGTDIKNKASEAGRNFVNNIVNFFKNLPSKLWSWLQNTIQKVQSFVSNLGNKAREGGQSFFNNIVNKIREIPGNIVNIGRNIVEGLWNGIRNATTWIKDKVKNFAKGILDGMKSALGIHSPSTVFRDQVGKYIALGVGEGFDKNIKSVYQKMKSSVDYETQKLNTNLSTTALLKVDRDQAKTVTNDNTTTINNTQNFYSKESSPYEEQKQAKQQLRRLAYGM